MERAISFYEELLGLRVMEKDAVYSVFDINGFRFGLFACDEMKEPHTWGSNCLPSLSLKDLESLQCTLAGRKIVFPLTRIGKNWVAEICDSEGNHLELTAPVVY